MENYRNRQSEELAPSQTKLPRIRLSGRSISDSEDCITVAPRVSIRFKDHQPSLMPGDVLICEYSVGLSDEALPNAIETSVLWITEGKGEEDIGVHFFERRNKLAITRGTFNHPQRISTVVPASPLSYDGKILKIRWCVRVRVFMPDGQIVTEEEFFQLGTVQSP